MQQECCWKQILCSILLLCTTLVSLDFSIPCLSLFLEALLIIQTFPGPAATISSLGRALPWQNSGQISPPLWQLSMSQTDAVLLWTPSPCWHITHNASNLCLFGLMFLTTPLPMKTGVHGAVCSVCLDPEPSTVSGKQLELTNKNFYNEWIK